jgi:hypothetical protein
MNRFLELYNKNEYIKVCLNISKGFSELYNFIREMRQSGNLKRRFQLIEVYSKLFSNTGQTNYFRFEVERVIKPHYFNWNNIENQLNDGNSSHHILLKIDDSDLVKLDNLYEYRLTGLLRIFKNIFSIIDAPEYDLSNDALIKKEEIIRNVNNQMSIFLESLNRKQDIEEREKLKSEIIKNIPFNGFYHLTHISNLKGIIENGILSRNKLIEEGIKISDISNSSIQDKRMRPEEVYGLMIHDYVPLYINPKNPFLVSSKVRETIKELVLIEVNPHILVQRKKTLFSDGNAAEKETNFFGNKDELERVNWTLLQNGKWEEDEGKRIMCSEVLIPGIIHRSYIQKIYIGNLDILEEAMKTHMNSGGVELVVSSKFFRLENELN